MKKLLLIFFTILSNLVLNAQNDQDKWFEQHKDSIINYHNSLTFPLNPQNRGCNSPCTNPGFESGTNSWDYFTGTACTQPNICNQIPGFNPIQHTLMSVGMNDPLIGSLPVVPPGGGNNSLRIGNGSTSGYGASKASITFNVTPQSTNFTYRYAVVLEDPLSGHSNAERPYFRAKLKDQNGNFIQCGDYEVIAKPPMIGFISIGNNIYYKPWTSVNVPLGNYIGQCVTLEFTSSDCALGGHFGYAYIDAECSLLDIETHPTACGDVYTLVAPPGAVSYSWSNLTAGGTTGIVGSSTNQTAVVNQSGTYQVVFTSAGGPTCITTLTINVVINPPPIALFTNNIVCVGDNVQFTDLSTPTGLITGWEWDFDGDGITDSNLQNPTYSFSTSIPTNVTLIVTQGLCKDTITQIVTFLPYPVVNFVVDVPKGCPIHCVNFTDQSTVAGPSVISSWIWDFGDNQTSHNQNPTHCYPNTGKYDIILTVISNDGCVSIHSIPQMIEVYAIPVAEFTSTPNPVSSFNPIVSFINQSSSDVTYWNWDLGDPASGANNISALTDPVHTYPNIIDQTYLVTLIVHNANNCWDTVQHPVVVGPEFTFYIPNAFTPNYDGVNDDFNGYGVGIVIYDIWIFDRWGNMVYHTDKLTDRWDGKANNGKEIAQQDVFVWKVRLTDIFGNIRRYRGTVTLAK